MLIAMLICPDGSGNKMMLKAEQGGNNLRKAADTERMADQPFDRGQRYFMLKDILETISSILSLAS